MEVGKSRGFSPVFVLAAVYMVALALLALTASRLSPYDPVRQDAKAILAAPGQGGHVLGTDDLGRDVLSRILHGSRSALLVGSLSAFVAALAGGLVGLVAGMAGGAVDALLMTLMDGVLAFPTILAAMTVVAVLGFGLGPVTLALAAVYSPVFARLVRVECMAIKDESYVLASRSLGYRWPWIVTMHIIPNIAGKIIVQAATVFALAISVEASLSYLGLGTQPPNASWGLMLKDARNYIALAPWLCVYPGLAVFLTVLASSLVGDGLARRLGIGPSRL
jgi:peptide/nickel transport system permease protein